jgi:nucleosome binding factor SPN SPT16 subunit
LLSPKNGKAMKEGMVFNLSTAFQNIEDPKNKGKTFVLALPLPMPLRVCIQLTFDDCCASLFLSYALQLIDTVKIGKEKGIVFTEGAKSLNDCVFFLNGVCL